MTIAHLAGPIKGVKSYDKICSHLRHTQAFSDYLDRTFKVLDNANVAGWTFAPGGWDGDNDPSKHRNVAPPVWHLLVDWGKKMDGSDNIEKVNGQLDQWLISLDRVCSDESLDTIVEALWNTPACPTYFCKKDKLLGRGERKGKKDETINLWARYARDEIRDALCDKIARTQDKLRMAMHNAFVSNAFEQERKTFHERCIADEIKAVLLKFKDVAEPHVLKMAMDEFVCHAIMES